jgi:regulator of sirC expression with transglutaminase-like and TPR domain
MTELDQASFADEVRVEGGPRFGLSPFRAGLLFAREIAYPDLRPSDCVVQMEDLAADARRVLRAGAGPGVNGLALAEYLFDTAGFRGNEADYADPRNSYLNEVLNRRLGLPISLSVLYLAVGRHLGLPVAGVGLPGHFIAAVQADDHLLYVDPFNGGRPLDRAACVALVERSTGQRGSFDPAWLQPTPPRDIVARMLNNLRAFYVSVEDWPLAIRVVEHLSALQPEEASHLRDQGLLLYRSGAFRRASALLGEYLVRAPGASDVDAVREAREQLLAEMARLN